MIDWKIGLLVFAVLWAAQIGGTALQMRHYRTVLGDIATRWKDGFVGTGSARARFGRGAIAILVVTPTGTVRQALAMQGRSVFAKFKPMPELTGNTVADIRSGRAFDAGHAKLAEAFRRAVDQVDRLAAERANTIAA